MAKLNWIKLVAALALLIPASTFATAIPLTANAVIIDNPPFYSVGPEDGIGGGNYALNYPSFIDIPYAIFNFGAVSSVSSATLNWNFLGFYGNSGPATITLYAGNDADGAITTSDRFMGAVADTFTVTGASPESFDVTAFVNAALLLGPNFAVRLEAVVPPSALSTYYGGQFEAPSLDATAGTAIPEPASVLLLGSGLAIAALGRRFKNRA